MLIYRAFTSTCHLNPVSQTNRISLTSLTVTMVHYSTILAVAFAVAATAVPLGEVPSHNQRDVSSPSPTPATCSAGRVMPMPIRLHKYVYIDMSFVGRRHKPY